MQDLQQELLGYRQQIITPWLKVNPLYKHCNVAAQLEDENSVLSYYKKLIALRKHSEYSDLFVYGKTVPVLQTKIMCLPINEFLKIRQY